MSEASNISYKPTDGLCYDPSDEKYWRTEALDEEIRRAFEICHGCRMCFKYCDSFPTLFSLIDDSYDGDVGKLTAGDTARVMDACFQCKLCEVQCPYTPRDGHEFQLDFPKIVHRYRAQEGRKKGFSLRQRLLGNPDTLGRLARASLGLANIMNRVAPNRWLMEKTIGIHRKKSLPDFAPETFDAWAKKKGLLGKEPGGEVVIFQTCFVQNNEPEIGRDTVEVLQKNGVDVRCVEGLQCCGMPAWEHGDLDSLRQKAHNNLDKLMPYVDKGAKVLVVNPTCSMMMRREYRELLEGADRERAAWLAEAVVDASEFLWSIRDEERFNTDFKSTPGGKVAYHAPCHLRAQGIGFKGRDLLRKIPGVQPTAVIECCGHNGTYAMTVDGFEPSQKYGKKAFDGMKATGAETWASDCPLACVQLQQHAGTKPLHPMSVLARAYREDGFSTRASPEEENEA